MRRNNSLGPGQQLRSRDIFWAIGTLVLAFRLFYLLFWEFFGFILFFHQHSKERFKTRRNVAYRVKTVVKLGFFKFIILPIVSYDLTCVHRTRGSFPKEIIEMGLWHSRQRSNVQRTAVATSHPSSSSLSAIERHVFSKFYQEKEHHNIELPVSLEVGNQNMALC